MEKKLFKDLKQTLSENGYHHNGDKWGAAMGLFFDVASFVYEEGEVPFEWDYKPGIAGNVIDEESYNYEWLSSLYRLQKLEIGHFLHKLTNRLELAGISY